MASKKNRKKEIKRLFEKPIVLGPVIAAIITSVAGLLIALFEYVIDSRPPSYQNKTAVKLMSIEEIEAIITDENKLKCNSFKDTHRQSALTDTHERRPQPSRKGKKILCIFSLAKSLESVYNENE